MIWIALGINWALWAILITCSLISSRRQRKGNSCCITLVFPFVISLAVIIAWLISSRYTLWVSIAANGFLLVIPLVAMILDKARNANK